MIMRITQEYIELLEAQFLLKTKGYSIVPRGRYRLVIEKHLTDAEYSIYCIFWDILNDWSINHLKYGLFSIDYEVLELQLKMSRSKTRRIIKSLLSKGFIQHISKNDYSLTGFELRTQFTKKATEFNFYHELMKLVLAVKQSLSNNERRIVKCENKLAIYDN